ncbi:MAG: hypothetical protein JWO06_1717, partial [Bacteroidota bacterium]|nr:hypothetical protein [Bacteroidota bacterium]
IASAVSDVFGFLPKKNLLLSLKSNYNQLISQFTGSHRRNIAKAEKKGLAFIEDAALKQVQKFYIENVNPQKENFKPKHAAIFKALTSELVKREKAKIFAAIDDSGKLLAAVVVIIHHNRLIGIINTSSIPGKQIGASHFVFDNIIKKYAATDLVLDFEGSSIPGIARFYEGFGAQEERFFNYQHTIIRRLTNVFK